MHLFPINVKSVNKFYIVKILENCIFLKNMKCHNLKIMISICKAEGRMCSFPDLKPLKQLKIDVRLFYGHRKYIEVHGRNSGRY
jgi:hypothetical protein